MLIIPLGLLKASILCSERSFEVQREKPWSSPSCDKGGSTLRTRVSRLPSLAG